MKYLTILLFLIIPIQEKSPREIPVDLKGMGISDFFEPDEILRIWRFPEGGAAFEELIEIKRIGKNWTSIRYTYLLDEYIGEPRFKDLRKRQTLNLTAEQISTFVNKKNLQKNVKSTQENQICICDLYLAEYRIGKEENYFEFFLDEKGNNNSAKINMMNFLSKIIVE
ncbi:hypothetical protein [Gramella sp. KN1008]|uniref:hypothetical protein n=1 Tax=Gramella sp. KN1008 TaxID=2529298 RepID=UPI00103958C1|nr:hypothetical protein [Gramella sp. KN1008]TBW25545.1 hypothetical protein EZJ28_15930 [Gramella sp. KN1008]